MPANSAIRISFDEMYSQFLRILRQHHFPEEKAKACASIFTNNSLDGIYSHGINRFPRFIEYTQKAYINPKAEARNISSSGCLEQWDGQLGPGPTNALIAADRAMELANKHGLGLVALANTNHWMRGGTYGWHCATKGYAFIGWTNTIANLPAWGASQCKLGNNPLVIAIPYQNEAIVLDMALSQYSYGKLEATHQAGEQLPLPGGFNKQGELSSTPGDIIKSGRPLPIGYWKGAGLSLMLDLLATILSAGLSTAQITKQKHDEYSVSQVFIAIRLSQLQNFPTLEQSIQHILNDFLAADKISPETTLRYPGQHVLKTRSENQQKGIPVHPDVWKTILSL